MRDLPSAEKFRLFCQTLDGVEAAHLLGAVHRDLKPENILFDIGHSRLAVADFGIARFNEDIMMTLVETSPSQRLANFQYAAPDQRSRGTPVAHQVDIYALGLMLNELFTGVVPHGTQYRQIEAVCPEFGFLNRIVSQMLAQSPAERPQTIADVKGRIQMYQFEAVSGQQLSKLDGTVIRSGEIDEPLAIEPPRLVGADWTRGVLTLMLDRPVTGPWVEALFNMGSYRAVWSKPPQASTFSGSQATVSAHDHEVQMLIDHFKTWLPQATATLRQRLEAASQQVERQQREHLQREREAEAKRLRLLQNIRI
jgi:serine/threonine protein kinase